MSITTKTLEEICDPTRGITYGIVKVGNFIEGGVPVIRGGDIRDNRIFFDDHKRVSEDVSNLHKRTILKGGEILTNLISEPGHTAIVPTDFAGFNVSRDVAVIPLIDKVSHPYVNYVLKSPMIKQWLEARLQGSVTQKINLSTLKKLPISLPPLHVQKSIAHTLGVLDDKIELNRQMNATLEGMAQALFKSWFVDFDPVIDNALIAGNPIPEAFAARAETRRKALADGTANRDVAKQFPAAFQFTEEMGWIPVGWEGSQLYTLINLIGGGTPKTSVEEYWNGSIPWFSVVDAPNDSDVFVVDTEKKITELGLEKSSTKILREGSTIISARGTVGKCALVGTKMAMNQSCYGIYGANGIADIYTYYTVRQFVSDLQHRGHGSVFNTITRDTFKSIYVPFGKTELTHIFDKNASSLLERVRFNLFQNIELINLRDTLLPKLISGELRIPEAEKITEEALA